MKKQTTYMKIAFQVLRGFALTGAAASALVMSVKIVWTVIKLIWNLW